MSEQIALGSATEGYLLSQLPLSDMLIHRYGRMVESCYREVVKKAARGKDEKVSLGVVDASPAKNK